MLVLYLKENMYKIIFLYEFMLFLILINFKINCYEKNENHF